MPRFLSIVVCLFVSLISARSGRAQDAAFEPDPVSVETVRRALLADRLQLTDKWLMHEDRLERERLRAGRWWAFSAHAFFTAGWTAAGVALMSEQAHGWGVAAFGVGAATLAMAIATRAVADDRVGARWSERLLILQIALMGSGAIVAQAIDDVGEDPVLGALGAKALVDAAVLTLLHVTAPSLYISEHYAGFRARSDSERVEHGLALLLEREQRQRYAAYTGFSMGLMNAGLYAAFAVTTDRNEARPLLAITASSLLINASINLILQLVTRTPSESILMGLPPPAGDKH
jgi:hypothetical protein